MKSSNIKKLNIILALLAVLIWCIFFSYTTKAQDLNVNIGYLDIENKIEGKGFTWTIGASTIVYKNIGLRLNYKTNLNEADRFKSGELYVLYRFPQRKHVIDFYLGSAYRDDKKRFAPAIGLRNAFYLYWDVWLVVDFENTFGINSENNTYLLTGFKWNIKMKPRTPKKIRV